MDGVKARRFVLGLVAFAVALGQLAIAGSAEATSALFRIQRYFYGVLPETDPIYTMYTVEPIEKGPNKAPSAVANLGTESVAQGFTFGPRDVFNWQGTYYCTPKACWPGYPISGGYYSYYNGTGVFQPNNPYGATMTTTVWFPTTRPFTSGMFTTGGGWRPDGQGAAVTDTTVYGGRYNFDRGGMIQITPGPNHFGGTMRLIYGPNALFYQLITFNTPFTSIGWGVYKNLPGSVPSTISQRTSSGGVTRYRVTPTPTLTTSMTVMGGTNTFTTYRFTPIRTTGGELLYTAQAHYLATIAPWTSGRLQGYQPIGTFYTRWTNTGYDNRTPDGLSGNLSLVWARLRHTYLVTNNPSDPITTNYNALRMTRMTVMFNGEAPEPGVMLMLGTGIVTLAGLIHLRRR